MIIEYVHYFITLIKLEYSIDVNGKIFVLNKMKIIVILCVIAIVVCSEFSNMNLESALHENGSVYGWREDE